MKLYLDEMIEREIRRDELAEIQTEQMLAANGIIPQPWSHRLLAGLGDLLIATGMRLHQRYANLSVPTTSLLAGERQTPCV